VDVADRVEWHLENWGRWMRSGSAVSGFPHRACGCTSWGDAWDDDTVLEASERVSAKAVHAIIEGLALAERLALNCRYLAARYADSRQYIGALATARENVGAGLKRRGIW
jgi:hypothetical protein